jgi:RimJ/RimL family protein N-acetyltransferase
VTVHIVFRTERADVRRWEETDADRLFDILSRAEVVRWLGRREPMTERDQAVQQIRQWNERFADGKFGCWAMHERTARVPAGSIILQPLPNGDGEVEIGWNLHPDSWWRGLATEGARGALRYGFGLGLDEILAVCKPGNEASIRVCNAVGMEDVGTVEDRWYEGRLRLFRMTRDDYEDDSRFGGLI